MKPLRQYSDSMKSSVGCALLLALLGIAPSPVAAQPFAYVANSFTSSVSVIDTTAGTVIGTPISVGSGPWGVAITPDGAHVYVTSNDDHTVSVIATATNTVVATIPAVHNPAALAITPDGAHVYVTSTCDNAVSVIDTATNTVGATITLAGLSNCFVDPFAVAITPDGAHVYVADYGNSVSVIDTATNTVIGAPIPVGNGPWGIAITPDGAHVYVTNSDDNTVSVIATATNTVVGAPIPVGDEPLGITSSPDGAHVYVANGADGTVSVINTATNTVGAVISLPSGSLPRGVALIQSGAYLFVTDLALSGVYAIATATNTVVATIPTVPGGFPEGITIAAGGPPPEPPVRTIVGCSQSLQNNIGDTISGTAFPFSTTINENGEGELLQVTSSGGELNVTTAAHNLATPFSYVATSNNETITGLIGFDGDETCAVYARAYGLPPAPSPPQDFGHAEKKAANNVAFFTTVAFSLTLGIIIALACGTATPFCAALIFAAYASGLVAAVASYIANDPSDPNFTVIATPNIPNIPPIAAGSGVTQAEADALNALIPNQAAFFGIGMAAVTSANRAQGAFDAGNSFWEARQTQAATLYLTEMGSLLPQQAQLLAAFHDSLVAAGVSVNFTSSDVLKLEQQIASNGLPPQLVQVLTTFGADQATINQIKNLVIVQDINAVAGNFPANLVSPNLTTALQAAAQVFSGRMIEIKPGSSFPPPVNPQSQGVIPVALLSSSTFDATKVDPHSVKFGPFAAVAVHSSTEDVNGDGKLDLVLQFKTQDTGIQCTDSFAALTGMTFDGQAIHGGEAIQTVGCLLSDNVSDGVKLIVSSGAGRRE
jgi:YVTN family beta-propeller protein